MIHDLFTYHNKGIIQIQSRMFAITLIILMMTFPTRVGVITFIIIIIPRIVSTTLIPIISLIIIIPIRFSIIPKGLSQLLNSITILHLTLTSIIYENGIHIHFNLVMCHFSYSVLIVGIVHQTLNGKKLELRLTVLFVLHCSDKTQLRAWQFSRQCP